MATAPMIDLHKKAIQKTATTLLENLDPSVSTILNTSGIFTKQDLQNINDQGTRTEKVKTIIEILPMKEEKAFDAFCDALRETEQGFLALALEDNLSDPKAESSAVQLTIQDLIHHQLLFDKLSRCLDRKYRIIKYWLHWAQELGVPVDVQKQCNIGTKHSPTEMVFEFLEGDKPDLTIRQLKEALQKIKRIDVYNLITQSTNFKDEDKVTEVITSSSSDVLDNIAVEMDTESGRPVCNWKNLAHELGVPRKKCKQFEMYTSHNPTVLLFDYLSKTRKDLTMKDVTDSLRNMGRKDVFQKLEKGKFKDTDGISKVFDLDSDLLDEIVVSLNKDVPGLNGWRGLGSRLGVPVDYLDDLDPSNGNAVHSSTRKMLNWLASARPDTTVEVLVRALRRIQRNDAIEIIGKIVDHIEPKDTQTDPIRISSADKGEDEIQDIPTKQRETYLRTEEDQSVPLEEGAPLPRKSLEAEHTSPSVEMIQQTDEKQLTKSGKRTDTLIPESPYLSVDGAISSRWREGEPTHDQLQDLADHLPDIWKRLGSKLGVKPHKITGIDNDNNNYKDIQQKAYAMLEYWKQSGLNQTYEKLGEALLALQKEKLAEQFCGRE